MVLIVRVVTCSLPRYQRADSARPEGRPANASFRRATCLRISGKLPSLSSLLGPELSELRAAADRLAKALADVDEEELLAEFKDLRLRGKRTARRGDRSRREHPHPCRLGSPPSGTDRHLSSSGRTVLRTRHRLRRR